MANKYTPSESIKELVESIIVKNNIEQPIQVDYYPGSEAGDGYASKTIAVDIKGGNKSLNLFLKCALPSPDTMPLEKLYTNEVHFYDIIYPAFKNFARERNVEDFFTNVPECYGASKENTVALENIKKRNFVLFYKSQHMNDEHLAFVFKVFAKFHAISFAIKDQEPKKYEEIMIDHFNFEKLFAYDKILKHYLKELLNNLDPLTDKRILDVSSYLEEALTKIIIGDVTSSENSVLTQGDAWVNNMMFQYELDNRVTPKDIMLIDWQLIRPASPVYDLSHFFYTIASKETLSKLEKYLQIYHEELSRQIRKLGSNPEILYPYDVFEKEWKHYGKYGFAMAFLVLKAMLCTTDEVPNYDNMDMKDMEEHPELMFPVLQDQEEYISRLKNLAEHFIEKDFL